MDEFKYVSENSKYVTINQEKILEFVDNLSTSKYEHWLKEINLNLNEEQWILLTFIIEFMNFCFWQKPKWKINYHGKLISGSNALFFSIIKQIENNSNFLNIDNLYNLDKKKFYSIFKAQEGTISLIEERYNNFKETLSIIYNNKNFYKDLYSIHSDIELLNYIVENFSSFDDKSIYKGKTIHFNKRAVLLTNDLFYVSKKIHYNIKNVNNLSGCADYGIPRTFRDYGILIYSDELKILVDNEKEILHNSEMEVEIRANMLYVLELIKEELKKKNIIINSVDLDNLIWWMGKKNENKKSIVHHTVTIFY